MFLGDNLLTLLLLAMGGALAFGNIAALVRPPAARKSDGDLDRPPLARSLVMIVIGLVATIWAIASLIAG